MLYPLESGTTGVQQPAGLYFEMERISALAAKVKQSGAKVIEETERTFYGRKEITFLDNNGFQVTFSCEPDGKN